MTGIKHSHAEPKLVIGKQFTKFSLLGLIGTAAHYAVLIATVEVAGMSAVVSSTLGFCVGAVVNYELARRYVFGEDRRTLDSAWKFGAVALAGLFLNGALMHLMNVRLGIHYLLAQIAATGAVLLWNFSANKWWSFKS